MIQPKLSKDRIWRKKILTKEGWQPIEQLKKDYNQMAWSCRLMITFKQYVELRKIFKK